MKQAVHSLVRLMTPRCPLLLIAALGMTAGCHKKSAPPPPAAQQSQPLTGEVDPFMTSQLRLFIQQQGHPLTNFTELARTSLDRVPRTPPDKTWAIDYTSQEIPWSGLHPRPLNRP